MLDPTNRHLIYRYWKDVVDFSKLTILMIIGPSRRPEVPGPGESYQITKAQGRELRLLQSGTRFSNALTYGPLAGQRSLIIPTFPSRKKHDRLPRLKFQ